MVSNFIIIQDEEVADSTRSTVEEPHWQLEGILPFDFEQKINERQSVSEVLLLDLE